MKNYIPILLAILFLFACDTEYNSNSSNDNNTVADKPIEKPTLPPTSSKDATAPPTAFVIDANKKIVGLITPADTEADLIKSYGEKNVQKREIGLGEGETTLGTVVLPGTDEELIIEWLEGATYQKIKSIRIEGENASWKTVDGIGIGTSLEDLEKINGKAFKFYGFEWDYAGTTNEWEGGKISKNITLILTPDNPQAVFPDLLGDQLFSSKNPKAQEAGLKVSAMVINFEKQE
ncbi:MAG TPA: hypothetical protein ENK52_02190 [Saprospiraceae bacterium]|nr:hypothetical protein [Saprospiraceae bacterium]